MSKRGFSSIVLIVLLLLVFVAGSLSYKYFFSELLDQTKQATKNKTQYWHLCGESGWKGIPITQAQAISIYMERKTYLPIYKVKSGDSLLSIAKNQLGSTNRLSELTKLNPQLNPKDSFIEIGQELVLPPSHTTQTSGDVTQINGYINEINGNEILIKTTDIPGEVNRKVVVGSQTKLPDGLSLSDLKIKDCIFLQSRTIMATNCIP